MIITTILMGLLITATPTEVSLKEDFHSEYINKQNKTKSGKVNFRFQQCGPASWYGKRHAGRKTANGETFEPRRFTAASWYYRLGSRIRVTNQSTGRSVIVRINDRGPSRRLKRIIDLSEAAFRSIADTKAGVISVCVQELDSGYS